MLRLLPLTLLLLTAWNSGGVLGLSLQSAAQSAVCSAGANLSTSLQRAGLVSACPYR